VGCGTIRRTNRDMVNMIKRSSQLDRDEYEHLINHYLIRDDWQAAYQCSLEAVGEFKDDGEFQYLHGSICAYLKKFEDAVTWLSRSIQTGLNSFFPAVFQLGLIYLTSGRIDEAKETWADLEKLEPDHYFRLFREGMLCLIKNEFEKSELKIKAGIQSNTEFPSINNDMEIVLIQIGNALGNNKNIERHYSDAEAE
jgi:tetratricopeptide (TPR) repeat protein